jgi:hypothetical protein
VRQIEEAGDGREVAVIHYGATGSEHGHAVAEGAAGAGAGARVRRRRVAKLAPDSHIHRAGQERGLMADSGSAEDKLWNLASAASGAMPLGLDGQPVDLRVDVPHSARHGGTVLSSARVSLALASKR